MSRIAVVASRFNGFTLLLDHASLHIANPSKFAEPRRILSVSSNNYLYKCFTYLTPNFVQHSTEVISSSSTQLQEETYNEKSSHSVLEPCDEDISTFAPYMKPTFNIAAYVNNSPTLQQLIKLGVDLHKLEKKKDVTEFLLRMDFERDLAPHIRLLHNIGIQPERLGNFITKNPNIFQEKIDDLTTRINYLEYKRFPRDGIARIVSTNPYWLSFSTKEIDSRLGFFQKTFFLSGAELRGLAQKQPKLITYSIAKIKESTFAIKEEMGFTKEEVKKLLLQSPRLWIMSQKSLLSRFNFVHNEMKIPHERIVQSPKILSCREFRVRQRHLFLVALNRAQYDTKLDGYVSLDELVSGTDVEFCDQVAKASVETFNDFLKTL